MSTIRTLLIGLVVIGAACGGSASSTTRGSVTTMGTVQVPRGQPLLEGVPVITVLAPGENEAGEAPQFGWEPVEGATRYLLAVLGPEGPLWAWQGPETEVYLGGLPFARPPGWAGPVIVPGTCWSVVAVGVDGHVIAVSEFLPVSPGESAGHTCTPGAGS